MKYLVRLNLKAFNPITRAVIASRLWEVEQCAFGIAPNISQKVIWHCADVRINTMPIRELFKLPSLGEKPWELEVFGVCVRGQDDVIEIHTGDSNASGN